MMRCQASCGVITRVVGLLAVALLGGAFLSSLAAAAEPGFISLFDGKTLDGWDGDPAIWRVEDGTITGETTADTKLKTNTFLIWRKGEVDDFELRFQYRFQSEKGNSGVQYRSWQEPESVAKWSIGGYQADFEAGTNYSGILYGERFRGILAKRGEQTVIEDNHKPKLVNKFAESADLQKFVKQNDWNSYRVVAQGFHFIHELNGHKTIEVTDEDTEKRRDRGLLALQVHVGPPMKVQFRNLELKPLKGK